MTIRLRPLDVALPLALLALGAAELATLGTTGWVPSVGLEAVAAAALIFRRIRPAIAVPVSAVALMVIPLTGTRMEDAATPIFFYVLGIYSLGRYLSSRSGVLVLVLTLGLVFADFGFDPADNDWTDLVFILSLAIPPFVFGRITRRMADQSEQIARQAEQLRDRAVRDERDRIARDLHDVIAHSLSAMVVQTAAAQDLVRSQPDRALAMLESVAETGRRTLAETGRLLHLIRDESDELGLQPAPGIAELPTLLEEFRDAGLVIDTRLELPGDPLPGGVDISAYRIVQEALTNALRYGDGAASLVVAADGAELRIECANRVGRTSSSGAGLGLAGMAERVALLGGTMRHGRTGDDYEVDARIPLPAAVSS